MRLNVCGRTVVAAACLLLLVAVDRTAWSAVPINLNTWSQKGPAGNGTWTVGGGGTNVFQSINGDPTFFVSPDNFINTTFNGKFRVETTGDDDYIGFVFGYQSPLAGGNDFDFLLFDWKQADQSSGGFLAKEGFSLSRVNGTITDYLPGFWGHTDSSEFDVLATSFSSTSGWAANTEYDFTLLYQTNRIKIDIAGGAFGTGQTIFDVAGTFPEGRFGFYNYSQSSVRYQGFTEEETPPNNGAIPEPTTILMWGSLFALGTFRQRMRGSKVNFR